MARIILVDDDELLCDVVCDALTAAGHMVSTVGDGESAVAAVRASEPDLLVLDYNLPGMSGLEVLRRVRSDTSVRNLPIMMLTREDGRLIKARADHDGADEYVVKPCKPEELVSHVETLLADRHVSAASEWLSTVRS